MLDQGQRELDNFYDAFEEDFIELILGNKNIMQKRDHFDRKCLEKLALEQSVKPKMIKNLTKDYRVQSLEN